MNRVLRQQQLVPTPRPWRAGAPGRDPAREAELASATAAAYERGVADGVARERAEGIALAAAIRDVLDDAATTRREDAEAQAAELVRIALEVAERILGHAAHDGGVALEARVREALGNIDDAPLELAVHPVDAERLRGVAASDPRLELVTDAGLRPGEARIRGRWAQADLTREAAVAAARSALP